MVEGQRCSAALCSSGRCTQCEQRRAPSLPGVPSVSRAGGTGTANGHPAAATERAFPSSMRGRSRRTRGGSATRSRSWIGWKPSKGTAT